MTNYDLAWFKQNALKTEELRQKTVLRLSKKTVLKCKSVLKMRTFRIYRSEIRLVGGV